MQNTKGPGLELFCVITLMSERVHGNSLLQHIAQFKLLFHMCIYLNRKKEWNHALEACFGKKKCISYLREYSDEV